VRLPPPAWWLWYSSAPGMAVPGMACPGMIGTGSYPLWLYIGHVPALYFDYADTTTQEILSPFPGLWYTMAPVSSRAGLAVPPPDTRWLTTANRFSLLVVTVHHAAVLAAARAHSAALQASWAARPVPPQPAGTPQQPPPPPPVPAQAGALAAARRVNADLQARMGRGETVGS